MKNKRIIIGVSALLLVCCMVCVPLAASALSPGMEILENTQKLVKSGLILEDVVFTAQDFDFACGGKEKVDGIVVSSLPNASEGSLYLGAVKVTKNQEISRANLGMLRYTPHGNNQSQSTFDIAASYGEKERGIECIMYTLTEENSSPVALSDNRAKQTYKNIAVWSSMDATDAENDALTYRIVSYPRNGLLDIEDASAGNYSYTPQQDFCGNDSFVFAVSDKYGNVSEECEVVINISDTDTEYTDMKGHWGYAAAVKATEAGVMSEVEKSGLFAPEEEISRVEFLFACMDALGIKGAENISGTVFADDDMIDEKYKPYVATAESMGYISGVGERNGREVFAPTEPLTRAQAAVMISRMLGDGATKSAFEVKGSNVSSVPAWAADAMAVMSENKIMCGTDNGDLSPDMKVTRAQTATMLCAMMDIK